MLGVEVRHVHLQGEESNRVKKMVHEQTSLPSLCGGVSGVHNSRKADTPCLVETESNTRCRLWYVCEMRFVCFVL